jgi:2-dehydro-3-deoxygalactonokinase
MADAALIGIDWGTTSLRAWKIAGDGTLLDTRRRDLGILRVPGNDFAAAFAESVGDWHGEGLPVLMSGMIGSRQGWVEAPYLPCPADLTQLAGQLCPVPGHNCVWIVPGLSLHDSGRRDVMRGEETQIAGAIGNGSGVVILPGTHSKWVRVEGGAIADFATFMTGELYDVLVKHSILGRLMADDPGDREGGGFAKGLAAAQDSDFGLGGSLFSARTLGLFGDVPAGALGDYLSGLLIGHEVREAKSRYPTLRAAVIGSEKLVERYGKAIRLFGIEPRPLGEDAGVNGLVAIARRAGLVKDNA